MTKTQLTLTRLFHSLLARMPMTELLAVAEYAHSEPVESQIPEMRATEKAAVSLLVATALGNEP